MSNKVVEYILRLNSGQFQAGIAQSDEAAQRLNNTMGSLGSTLGLTLGAAGVAAFTKSMIDVGSRVEDARVGLTTLLKDAGAARGVINATMDDATKTPFEFESLLMSNKALISAGVAAKDARTDVLNLANAIAATGGGNDELQRMVINLQQIKNTGEATSLDIKQFAFAGVNMYALLEAAGQKVDKNNKDQVISYDMITKALQKAHEQGGIYYNGLENMAGNTSVQISNLGDAMFQLKVKMFEDLKPEITSLVQSLADMIDKLKVAAQWITRHKEFLKETAKALAIGAAAWGTYTLVVKGAQVAMALFSATASATPFGAIALGIGAISVAYGSLAISAENARNKINDLRNEQELQTRQSLDEALTKSMKESGMKEEQLTEKVALEAVKRSEIRAKELSKAYDAASTKGEGWYQTVMGALTAGGRFILHSPEDPLQSLRDEMNKNEAVLGAAQRWLENKKSASSAGLTKSGLSNAAGSKPKRELTSRGVGSKAVTINVHINDLVKEFKVSVTNLKEDAYKIKDIITQTLSAAINDAQVVAEH